MNEVITVRGISNAEFFAKHAAPGRIGLTGGATLVDRAIRRAERHVCDGKWSNWSHAFIFGAGHISKSLSKVANLAGFSTVVIDNREAFANRERFPEATIPEPEQ